MPFTLSHPAAVLPFLRTPLLPAALVIGSMIPDLPYFLPVGIPRGLTHSLVGSFTIDLAMGLIAFAVWRFVLRAPLRDFSPRWLRGRWHPDVRAAGVIRTIGLLVLSLLVGIVTHQVWDSFTHPDGWVVLRVGFLRGQLGSNTVSHWAQYASSVSGLLVLVIWAILWIRRTRPRSTNYAKTSVRSRAAAWVTVISALVITALTIWLPGLFAGTPPLDPALVFHTVVYSMAVAGAVCALACLAWYVLPLGEGSA
ncbi:DUF4184 family protein [soil metagenome]